MCAAIVFGTVKTFNMFLVAELLYSLAISLISGTDKALLYDSLIQEGKEAQSTVLFGKLNAIMLAGLLISAPLGGIMAQKLGLNTPLLFSAIPFALAIFVVLSIDENDTRSSEKKDYKHIIKTGFLLLYKNKKLRSTALDGIIVATAAYFVLWLYPLLLKFLNFPIFYYGFIYSFLAGSQILISANYLALEKLFGSSKRLLDFAAIITGIAFIVVGFFPNFITVLFFVTCAGGFGLTRLEFMFGDMNAFIPSPQRATMLSFISMFRRSLLIILNPLVGLLATRSLSTALILIGIIPFLALLFLPYFTAKNKSAY